MSDQKRGGRPLVTDPAKLPAQMPDDVKALVIELKLLLKRAGLTCIRVANGLQRPLTSQQFYEQLRRVSGPPPFLYTAIVQAAADQLQIPYAELHAELKPLHDAVYGSSAARVSPAPAKVITSALPDDTTAVVNRRSASKWLLEMLRGAMETEAIAELDSRFHGDDMALAKVLIDLSEVDLFAVALLLDTLAETDYSRALAIHRVITGLDKRAAAEISEVCDGMAAAEKAIAVEHEQMLSDRDPDVGAGQRIASLLKQERGVGRVVREIRIKVEQDIHAAQKLDTAVRIAARRRERNTRARPTCSRAFRNMIHGIAGNGTLDDARVMARLLHALHGVGDLQSLDHCVTALFDLPKVYMHLSLSETASEVFEHLKRETALQIVSGICTDARLSDEIDGLTTYSELRALLYALTDRVLTNVARGVASLPPNADFSVGHFVECLPNTAAFWSHLVADSKDESAGVLIERAVIDWMSRDPDQAGPIEDFPPLRGIANALIDVDATSRMRAAVLGKPPNSPVTALVQNLALKRSGFGMAVVRVMLLIRHLRIEGLLHALVSDRESGVAFVRAVLLQTRDPFTLFSLLLEGLPTLAPPVCDVITASFDPGYALPGDELPMPIWLSKTVLDRQAQMDSTGVWARFEKRLRMDGSDRAAAAIASYNHPSRVSIEPDSDAPNPPTLGKT
ncbi:hypothetical protein [Nocardia sp. NPDC051832]|uniref:hypothetical protein n=1 Tax=Nocardia sp. NPDC051832 TaxID=3155673 RepID=UPI003434D001